MGLTIWGAAAFGAREEGLSMGIVSVNSMWLLPTFFIAYC
jgi:hypothetical protein